MENWIELFRKRYKDDIYVRIDVAHWVGPINYDLELFISAVLEDRTEKVISYIGNKQGWEESEDYYRKHFGLDPLFKVENIA